MEHSLIVKYQDQEIFLSDRHWLYPLFELEDFLNENRIRREELYLVDKIAGRAAACLMVHLGIRKCHIVLLSQRAISVFEKYGVEYTYDQLVDHILCKTEEWITPEMDIESTHLFLRKRAGRVQGIGVRIENLTVNLDQKSILEGLNLTLNRGEQLIIEGANGVGKTTLLKAMLGIIPFVSGSIYYGELKVGSAEWKEKRHLIGYVHQEGLNNNFPISALEVVSLGLIQNRESVKEQLHLIESAMRRTGCYHIKDQSYHRLSGGEKQRVSIARCLCQNARVLLLDEPVAFLDQSGKGDLRTLLSELTIREVPTILIVSHDAEWNRSLGWERAELKGGKLW